jgi:adenylate cyclase
MNPQVQKSASAILFGSTSKTEQTFTLLDRQVWRIGRSADNDIVLDSDFVSRYHAMIQRTDETDYYLIDMGSRNGSSVNRTRVNVPVALHTGDEITIGDWTLRFQAEESGALEPVQKRVMDETTVTLFAFSRVTVVVLDIRDFTGLTRRLNEGVLCQLIGTWFRKGGDILSEHGSWGQKYIGDAIMSIWVHDDKAMDEQMRNIFQALVKLFDMTANLQMTFELGEPIRIGAGVNSGYAMVGNTGSGSLNDHTALGDAVNAAFRFESACKEARVDIVAGGDTYANLSPGSPLGDCFRQFTVSLKGYEQPWCLWGAAFPCVQSVVKGWPAGTD